MASVSAGLTRRIAAFGTVGGFCTALQYALLSIWVHTIGSPVALGTAIGYGASATVNYLLNYHWTFHSNQAHLGAISRFIAMVAFGLTLNAGVVAVLADWLKVHYLLAQLVATGFTFTTNFLISNSWTFRRPRG